MSNNSSYVWNSIAKFDTMKVLASQSCPAFCDPMDYTLLPSTSPRLLYLSTEFSRQEYWSGLSSPFSGGSSRHKDWTLVSCIAVRFFTVCITREALI